jgi:P27 family predicted phage terminase small subunit
MSATVRAPGAGKKQTNLAVGDESIKRAVPPAELMDEKAKECWKENSKILIDRNTFSREDAILLLSYCNAFAMMLKCDVELAGSFTTESGMGGLKKHPLVNVRNDAFNQLVRAGSLLGLNPLSRARFLQGESGGGDDSGEFDDF